MEVEVKDIALEPASAQQRPSWFPGNYQWENSDTRYFQLLDERGLILDGYWERKHPALRGSVATQTKALFTG